MREKTFNAEFLKKQRISKGFKSLGLFVLELRKYYIKASKSMVHSWEHGKSEPSGKYLNTLCEIFEKQPDEFYYYKK